MSTGTAQADAGFARPPKPYPGISPRRTIKHSNSPTPGLCPDIISMLSPVKDSQSEFGSDASWSQMYDVAPQLSADTYYYVRGRNSDTAAAKTGRAKLYWSTAQLIMWPSLWMDNALPAGEQPSSQLSASAGGIGVTSDAFVWSDAPITSDPDGYYCFATQVSDGDVEPGFPIANSVMEMSALLRRRDLGWRNTSTFDGHSNSWRRVLELQAPKAMAQPTDVILSLFGEGLKGATVALRTADAELFSPVTFVQDNELFGIPFTLEPGTATTLEVGFWNTTGAALRPGATLALAADYPIPDSQLADAIRLDVVSEGRSDRLRGVRITPKPVAPLGAATFIAT